MVKKIYDHFEYEYTPEFDASIKGYVDELDKERQASRKESQKHDYTLQSFGLTEDEVYSPPRVSHDIHAISISNKYNNRFAVPLGCTIVAYFLKRDVKQKQEHIDLPWFCTKI